MDNKNLEELTNAEGNHVYLQTYFDKNKFSDVSAEVTKEIYSSCDVENSNCVRVSKLLEFIAPYAADSSLELLYLKKALDPSDVNPAINLETFSKAFTEWTLELNQQTFFHKYESTEESSDSATSPDVSKTQNKRFTLHEQINQLKFQNNQLTSQLDIMQNQLNTCEDENKSLIIENSEIKNKMLELQQLHNNLKATQKDIEKTDLESSQLNTVIKTLEKSSVSRLKEILELNKSIDNKESKNEQLENSVNSLKKSVKEKEKIISKLQEEAKTQDDTIALFGDVKTTLDSRIKELENLLEHFKQENNYLKSEKEKLEQQYRDNTTQMMFSNDSEYQETFGSALSKQNSETSLDDDSYKDALWKFTVANLTPYNSLDKEMSHANKNLIKDESLLEKIKSNLAPIKEETPSRFTITDITSLELKILDLEADNNKKYIRIVDLMEQKEQLQKQLNANIEQHSQEIQTLKDENNRLKTENGQIQLILCDLTSKKTELENQNQNQQTLIDNCAELEDTLNQLKKQKEQLVEEFNETSAKSTELEKEVQRLNKIYKECDKENIQLREKIANLEEKCAVERVSNNEKIGKSIEVQFDGNLNEVPSIYLSNKLLKKEKQVKILEKMVDYQNLELEALNADKKRHLDQIYELKSSCDKLSTQVAEFNTHLEDCKKEKDAFKSEIEFLNKLNDSLQVDLQNVNESYDSFQTGFCPIEEYNFLVKENKTIKLECEGLSIENKELQKTNLKMEEQLISLIEKTNKCSSNLTEFRNHIQNYKQIISKMKKKLNTQKHKTCNIQDDEYLRKINHLEDANVLLQMQLHDLREEYNTTKINFTILNKEKEKWFLEKKELNDAKEKLLRDLDQSFKEKKQVEIQLHKKNQMVCEHCVKLHKEKDELYKHIKDLQYEIGLLEKEIYAPKKGNYEHAQIQLEKLKINLEVANELLQHEKHNNESVKQQNTKLLFEINEISNQTLQEKTSLENEYKESIKNLKEEIEQLQIEKKSLHNSNCNIQQELETSKKKNEDLQKQVVDLYGQNVSLEKKLDEVLQELKKKTSISVKLQADLQEEEMLLELFHQKSMLFQQNIDTVYNQKSILEKKLQKAINDLQKSENKYLSIRKLLVDAQSHVSGDFKNILQAKESEDKIVNLESTLKNCQEELCTVKLKCAESVMSFNSLKDQMNAVGLKAKKNRKRLNKSILTLVSSWHEMLEKVIDVQLILDSLASNESDNVEELDEEILKLENEIHLTVEFLNALSTFKFTVKSDDNVESLFLHNSKFVKKLTLKSTVTKIQSVSSEQELSSQNSAVIEYGQNHDTTNSEEEKSNII